MHVHCFWFWRLSSSLGETFSQATQSHLSLLPNNYLDISRRNQLILVQCTTNQLTLPPLFVQSVQRINTASHVRTMSTKGFSFFTSTSFMHLFQVSTSGIHFFLIFVFCNFHVFLHYIFFFFFYFFFLHRVQFAFLFSFFRFFIWLLSNFFLSHPSLCFFLFFFNFLAFVPSFHLSLAFVIFFYFSWWL